jgi:diamine N-acetyltransferase
MTITLRPITRENVVDCVRLQTTEAQKHFVADNGMSLAQAYVDPNLVPRAVYADDTLVGFVMYGRDPTTNVDWIIRVMIDQRYQGRGYGRATMHELIAQLSQQPDCAEIRLSFEPDNVVAERLYDSLGFERTGEIDDGEVVMRLRVK